MKVIFALPGKQFSGNFLQSWTELIHACSGQGIQVGLVQPYSPVVYYARNLCLGGDNLKGVDQKPFGNQIDYDYIMWIDSDIVFTPEDFFKLLNHQKDIVSGLYIMSDNTHFATVKDWDMEFFKENGFFKFLTRTDIENKTELFPVDYTGMGWMLVKKGVFESMKYPWFEPLYVEFQMNDKFIKEFFSEDVVFCKKAKNNNFEVLIDPTVLVGHEKSVILN